MAGGGVTLSQGRNYMSEVSRPLTILLVCAQSFLYDETPSQRALILPKELDI